MQPTYIAPLLPHSDGTKIEFNNLEESQQSVHIPNGNEILQVDDQHTTLSQQHYPNHNPQYQYSHNYTTDLPQQQQQQSPIIPTSNTLPQIYRTQQTQQPSLPPTIESIAASAVLSDAIPNKHVDSQLISHEEAKRREMLSAKAARKFLRQRYLYSGKIFCLATVVLLLFITPILFIICYREARQDLNRFQETQCLVIDKFFKETNFKNLCPLTKNYIINYKVQITLKNIKYEMKGCSAEESTCMRGVNPNNYVCETCQPNHVNHCRPIVTLSLDNYDDVKIGHSYPCWVYELTQKGDVSTDVSALSSISPFEVDLMNEIDSTNDNSILDLDWSLKDEDQIYRVFLGNPTKLLGYPKTEKWWTFGLLAASVTYIISLYSLCKGHACSPKKICRSKQPVDEPIDNKATQIADLNGVDNGARCCFCFRTPHSYARFTESHAVDSNGHA